MPVAKLKPHVIQRTISEICRVAPGTDDCTRQQILAEILENYPGFLNGESNLLQNDDSVLTAPASPGLKSTDHSVYSL